MTGLADTGPGPAGPAIGEQGGGAQVGPEAAAPAQPKALYFVRLLPLVRAWRLVAILVGEFFTFCQYQFRAFFGLVWMQVQLAVMRPTIGVEVAATATRLVQASSGGE